MNTTIRNIIIFTVLVNVLAWLGPILGGDPTEPGLGFLVWGTAPLVSALIMKIALRDKISLGFRPNFKGNGRYYLLSLFLYPMSILLVLALGTLLGTIQINSFTLSQLLTTMAPLVITFFIFAFFEEVGWRGYLTPEVQKVNDRILGYIVIGVIWASWHFPYINQLTSHTEGTLITVLPRFLLGAIAASVVYGEIRLRTNSVWPAVLMHWSGNTVANTLLATFAGAGFVTLVPGKVWLGSFGMEGVLMILIFSIVGGGLYIKRRSKHNQLTTLAPESS